MVKTPQDRAAAIKPMIESMDGKLKDLWFCFGEYDIVAIAELPDNLTAAAMSMAIGSSGAMSSYRTTPLVTSPDAKKASSHQCPAFRAVATRSHEDPSLVGVPAAAAHALERAA